MYYIGIRIGIDNTMNMKWVCTSTPIPPYTHSSHCNSSECKLLVEHSSTGGSSSMVKDPSVFETRGGSLHFNIGHLPMGCSK